MIAKKKKSDLRVSNGSPKTAGILAKPASQAAVHNPASWLELATRIAGSGRTPDPLSQKKKQSVSACETATNIDALDWRLKCSI